MINFIGVVIGTFGGILASSKLVNFRLEQLEKKVDKHNDVISRTYNLEKDIACVKEDVCDIKSNIKERKVML